MSREKVKFALWIKPETQQLIRDLYPRDNCQSQSEFIEKAVRFYAGYAATKDGLEYLAPILSSTLTGIVHDSEKRICRMLFKLTVEISMMMHVIAAGFEVNEDRLPSLRERCIRDIRGTSGSISFEDAVRYQRG